MPHGEQKRDRTARLLRLQILLWQHPSGLGIEEIAQKCRISKRTAYRDLAALETELEVPIWEEGSKRGIAEGYFLPPIAFTPAEAVNIFLAIRKMQYFSPLSNSSVAATFLKLNTIVPPVLKNQIQNTLDHMEKLPRNEQKISNFDKLIQAWLSRHPVSFHYQEMYSDKAGKCTVESYVIEPSARNRASYVIGYCRQLNSIFTFVIDRIVGEVKIESDTYTIPSDFNIYDFLGSAWGAFADKKVETVKLRFSKRVSPAIKETIFHQSQVNEIQKNGSLIMTLKVNNTGDFHAWIMSFGKDVEVLEPAELRNQMRVTIQSLSQMYEPNEIAAGSKHTRAKREIRTNEITDSQWKKVTRLLPPQPATGRRRADDRMIINGILTVLKSNTRWNDIPRKYGAYSTCFMRFKTWEQQGIWTRIWETLSSNQ